MLPLRLIRRCPVAVFLTLIICGGTLASYLSEPFARRMALDVMAVPMRPYTMLTYVLCHDDLLSFLFNIAVTASCLVWIESAAGRGHLHALRTALSGILIPAGAFVLSALAFDAPAMTLTGASGLAFTLAVYISETRRTRSVTILFCIIALTGLFGPNAGGSVAHCAGALTGWALGRIDLRRDTIRASVRAGKLASIHRKIQVSGFSALTEDERRFLSDTDSQ